MIDETSGCQPTHVKTVGYGAVPTRNIVTVSAQHLASGHRVDKIDEHDLVEKTNNSKASAGNASMETRHDWKHEWTTQPSSQKAIGKASAKSATYMPCRKLNSPTPIYNGWCSPCHTIQHSSET